MISVSNEMTVRCDFCGITISRNVEEIDKLLRSGMKIYCNDGCAKPCADDNSTLVERVYGSVLSSADKYGPFRYHYNNAKKRNFEFSITLEDLKNQWDEQCGRCIYTGWYLEDPRSSTRTYRQASLDRIDSNCGYTPKNIQFVTYMANIAKNCYSDECLIEFCEAVTQHRLGKFR